MAWSVRALLMAAFVPGGLFAVSPAGSTYAADSVPKREVRPIAKSVQKSGSTDLPSTAAEKSETSTDIETIDVLEGLRSGQLAASAEGSGDGRMTLNLTNRSRRKLRVVLPPGLIATGVTGQFGGMGGGMGGGGMGGGGMGGMGGGMGGGGMGGMGGGMGGRGGTQGGGMMGGGTMPASMGMMMLGRLIMSLVGEQDSWDQRSLMSGMMMGMGGGMGGMGGGMGGMGGGMGGMGGGFRSVPPTSLPQTTLEPKQTRHLPTALVSLNEPDDSASLLFPSKGEPLKVGEAGQINLNPRTQAALKRLTKDKAPQTLCQLVMWHVAAGMNWEAIERSSEPWANPHELALARQFVKQLDQTKDAKLDLDSGEIDWEIRSNGSEAMALTTELRPLLEKSSMLGLRTSSGIPATPKGPAIAFRAEVLAAKVDVHVAATNGQGSAWVPLGSFTLKVEPAAGENQDQDKKVARQAAQIADAMAAGILGKLVRCTLAKGDKVKGKKTYKIRIDNGSPLILNGLALGGSDDAAGAMPSTLAGFCLPPRKSLTVPVAADTVDRLGLTHGVQAIAADLSGL